MLVCSLLIYSNLQVCLVHSMYSFSRDFLHFSFMHDICVSEWLRVGLSSLSREFQIFFRFVMPFGSGACLDIQCFREFFVSSYLEIFVLFYFVYFTFLLSSRSKEIFILIQFEVLQVLRPFTSIVQLGSVDAYSLTSFQLDPSLLYCFTLFYFIVLSLEVILFALVMGI